VVCTTVGQIIAIDGGQNHVVQIHSGNGFRHLLGFIGVESLSPFGRFHSTKATAPGTGISHEHKGGGAAPPALTQIGTTRLFTDCVQIAFAQNLFQMDVVLPPGQADLEPGRFGLTGKRQIFDHGLFFGLKAANRTPTGQQFFSWFGFDCRLGGRIF
jgi:hypothetical protein